MPASRPCCRKRSKSTAVKVEPSDPLGSAGGPMHGERASKTTGHLLSSGGLGHGTYNSSPMLLAKLARMNLLIGLATR